MAHTGVHIEMVFQIIFPGELAHLVVVGGGFDGGAGGVVVKNESGPGVVPYALPAHFIE